MTEQERQQHIERSNKISELIAEYKEIRFKMSRSMLPLREGNSYEVRLREIIDECWTYNFDIKKAMR